MVTEKKGFFKSSSQYKSFENLDPRVWASLDPSGLIGRIYLEDHYTLLHTLHISYGPIGFREC